MRLWATVLLVASAIATAASAAPSAWEARAPMPLPRTEVSAAVVGTRDRGARRLHDRRRSIAARRRVLARARRLATPSRSSDRRPSRDGCRRRRQAVRTRRLHRHGHDAASRVRPREGRMASAAAHAVSTRRGRSGVAGGRIVVAGGIGESRRLARSALSFDLRTRRWSVVPGPDAARAPRCDRVRVAWSTRSVAVLPASTRISCTSRASRLGIAGGGVSSRCRTRAAERARRRWRAGSSRSAARSRTARSKRCSSTGSPSGAGCVSPISRRRGTAWESRRSAAASTSSAAGPSLG